MPYQRQSGLFQVRSHSCYFRWGSVAEQTKAVSLSDSNTSINIGRVKRNDHIIPGALRDGVCRFYFEGVWHEERDQVEVMEDNFCAAESALSWGAPEEKDGQTLLSLNSVVGGEFPGGVYIIGRKRGTMDIVPIAVKEENRDFSKGHIVYEGEPITDIEVLESTYHHIIAICPRPPSVEPDATAPS